jgi:hypothetical protein
MPRPAAAPGSGFVGGFAPNLPAQQPSSGNAVKPSLAASYFPPPRNWNPPSKPPPVNAPRVNALPSGAAPAPRPVVPGAPIRTPQPGASSSSSGSLLSSLKNVASNAIHAATHPYHYQSPSTSGPSGSASGLAPPRAGEDEFNIDQVHARPGEPLGDWDELITNIRATAEDVANDFDEKDTIVPGFAEGVKLKPWQVQGRHWMLNREQGNRHGGILADDVSNFLLSKS